MSTIINSILTTNQLYFESDFLLWSLTRVPSVVFWFWWQKSPLKFGGRDCTFEVSVWSRKSHYHMRLCNILLIYGYYMVIIYGSMHVQCMKNQKSIDFGLAMAWFSKGSSWSGHKRFLAPKDLSILVQIQWFFLWLGKHWWHIFFGIICHDIHKTKKTKQNTYGYIKSNNIKSYNIFL